MGLDFNRYKNSSLSSLSSSRRDDVSQLTIKTPRYPHCPAVVETTFKVKNNGYARYTLDIFQGLQFNEAITKKQLHTYYPRVSNFKTSDEIRISIQHQDVYTLPSESFIYIEGKFKHDAAGTGTCELTKQLHTYYPRVSNFKTSDEIRISIQHQDVYTLPSESFIYIEGKFKHDAAGTGTCELTNNAYAFLFDQIRYEINGVEVDRCTKPGITSSIKGYIYGDNETKFLEMAGWCPNSKTQPTISLNNKFNAYIPLKFFLGFAEDYKKIIINASQELILLRSGNDLNCYHNTNTGGTKVASFDIDKIEWHVPHINVNDEIRLKLLKTLNSNKSIYMPFRKWELFELPSLRKTKTDVWPIKTSTNLEKPRYVIVTFQTARKDSLTADASKFDHASLTNLKLHLNADSFPYDNMNLQINENKYAAAYRNRMYASFQSSYYNGNNQPLLSYEKFKECALYVIDCANQKEAVKSSIVDVKLELESLSGFTEDTTAYCLIIHDNIVEYTPLSGTVKKII
ncbi:hypothetical protein QE152_g23218 [Popillia japonica]|uniref:Double jelly roll-like domain-containing protein n=1 Tax=Popillia japonica TaxID=7064 RepID=A0AAW1KI67_POPJA